ncbi:hypothetical protein MIND_01365500 [Mycena indigotica]|uniref:Acetyl-CoA synthetase-like protein n=1 Tax=Mycena indigotica TaxID=2126181 RepID=A0A8H6VS14_9AGAR|nr:uncharacterized protein MIND_01365500 [Mycena indigotica]KAF7289906.1 hypothetical protein MIND_01365500 [Mycena indigotica]
MLSRRISNHLVHQRTRRLLTHSSVQGALQPPLVHTTLPDYFASKILAEHSTRPALVCRKESPHEHGGPLSHNLGRADRLAWSFQEFDSKINALARGLLAMGVQPGERVGVLMGNNSAYAMLQWACASIGAILVTINPAYRVHELASVLNLVGVSRLFIVPRIRSSSYLDMVVSKFPELRGSPAGNPIQLEELPALRDIIVVDNTGQFSAEAEKLRFKNWIDWREILIWDESASESRVQKRIERGLNKDDVINLQFTSGTTGAPKAVSLTHHNLLNNGLSIGRCMNLTEQDVLDVFFLRHLSNHLKRLVLGNLAAWSHGACIVYPSEIFHPPSIVDAIIEEKCTALHGVPTHFNGVLSEVDKRRSSGEAVDIRNLRRGQRTGIAAGSPIPIELMKSLISKLNLSELTNAYGMTETSPVSFQTIPTDPVLKRVETVGRVQPHVKAKLIDSEGKIVPVGTPGEICVAGYLLQKGYWEDKQQTDQVMQTDEQGTLWMHTGDEGIMDSDGYLKIVSRIKDIIIRGGENLFPIQIEDAILTNLTPSVEEAAVVAVPDNQYGELVGVWIVRRKSGPMISREDIRRKVWEVMNPQNAPSWVFFVGEDGPESELPKTASGKVMKHILRDWSRDLAKRGVGRVQT